MAEGGNKKPFGNMTRRGFLKWLVGSIAAGVAAVSGKGLKQACEKRRLKKPLAIYSSEICRSRRNAGLVPKSSGQMIKG